MVMKLGLVKLCRGSGASSKRGDWGLPNKCEVSGGEMSTSDECSLDSMELIPDTHRNFPLRITEYIHHEQCALVVDDGASRPEVWGDMDRDIDRESVEVGLVDHSLARTSRMLHLATETHTMTNAKTSVDCQLDDIVLTMNRDNIFNELSYLCRPMAGKWETHLDHSDPLDPLFKQFGIGYVKRFVVDKLALQVDMSFTKDKRSFQLDLAIPFGNRNMKWDLHGESVIDNDPDCGMWRGHVDLIKFDINDICPKSSKTSGIMREIVGELPAGHNGLIYAPCQIRSHETIGVVHETRFSVPSKKYGKLCFLKYVLYPKNQSKPVVVMRCCKPMTDTQTQE